jgi:hypothetical protein
MRRLTLAVLMTTLATASVFADSLPTYSLTSGTVSLINDANAALGASFVQYNFSGPGGLLLAGFSDVPAVCFFIAAAGSCNPSTTTQPFDTGNSLNANAVGLSGLTLFSIGGIAITAAPVNLPVEPGPATLTLSELAMFSGSFAVCPLNLQDFDGCGSPALATFSANGTGIGQFQFSYQPVAGTPGFWTLTSATYTMTSPVPEPSSLALFGTGAMALVGKLARRKKRSSCDSAT